MRVKYENKIISKEFSIPGGTEKEQEAFLSDFLDALYEMGAPIDLEYSVIGGANFGAMLTGHSVTIAGELGFDGETLTLDLRMYGNSDEGDNYACSNIRPVGDASSAAVCIHAVKSGDSLFFGLMGGESEYISDGCITYAITPMRRLSDPSVNLGYAIVEATMAGGPDSFIDARITRTLPYVAGFNYKGGMLNVVNPGYASAFPEVDTGKIPLIPYYAGIEDIYYDKVYISPMKRGKHEEKAFETDKGVFLIGGEPGIDHTQRLYNTLAFDITEAVESAQ